MLLFVAVIPSGRRDGMMEKCITEMAEGDKDALDRLYEETHVAAYGFALSILKNTQDGVELDKEDGIMIYEVQFETETKKYEYNIHAVTGAVLSFEQKAKTPPAALPPVLLPDLPPIPPPAHRRNTLGKQPPKPRHWPMPM